jgi:hypothetical protein
MRPGTSAVIVPQFLSPCVSTASFSLLSSTAVHLPLHPLTRQMLASKTSSHLLLYWDFVRPGTNVAIAAQSLPPCLCTASLSWMTSLSVHLHERPLARSMLQSKTSSHLLFFVRPGTSAAVSAQLVLYSLLLLGGIRNCSNQICIFCRCTVAYRPGTLHGI